MNCSALLGSVNRAMFECSLMKTMPLKSPAPGSFRLLTVIMMSSYSSESISCKSEIDIDSVMFRSIVLLHVIRRIELYKRVVSCFTVDTRSD